MQDRAVTQAPEQTGLGMELRALPAAVRNFVITISEFVFCTVKSYGTKTHCSRGREPHAHLAHSATSPGTFWTLLSLARKTYALHLPSRRGLGHLGGSAGPDSIPMLHGA